jgi:hypothetical protein
MLTTILIHPLQIKYSTNKNTYGMQIKAFSKENLKSSLLKLAIAYIPIMIGEIRVTLPKI